MKGNSTDIIYQMNVERDPHNSSGHRVRFVPISPNALAENNGGDDTIVTEREINSVLVDTWDIPSSLIGKIYGKTGCYADRVSVKYVDVL